MAVAVPLKHSHNKCINSMEQWQQTAEQALTLSNLFPQMGANIENALLGQKQGMDVAVQLWDDFSERVKTGQYEVGEFTKYIQDMGYQLPPAIQAGVDKMTEMSCAAEDVTVSSKGAAAGVKRLAVLLLIFPVPLEKQPVPYLT